MRNKRQILYSKETQTINKIEKVDFVSIPKELAKTQQVVNEYIRKRDTGKPCISCGRVVEYLQAGHYWAAGHYTALRFWEQNIHGQCQNCNCHLHGNLANYTKGILARYGQVYLDKLLLSPDLRKSHNWNALELREIQMEFKQKIKEL